MNAPNSNSNSNSSHNSFYITGGTIPPGSPSYVARAADQELLEALKRGELCYVLNARQMGKSSLSIRTRQALEASGVRTAFLDLQKFGSSGTREQWYRGLLDRIGSDLKLRAEFAAYWRENAEMPALARLFGAIREVALERVPGNLVIFLDEIDVVRDQPFKTDEFFGAIREAYNERASDPTLARLTFCILGTVAPTDLIRDVRLSPFNIGTRIKLADLTREEATPLAGPLPGGVKTLSRAFWWTSGHPYLTQRLCAELAREGSTDVDAMVERLFFAKSDADVDENIKNVRNGMLRMRMSGNSDDVGFDRTDLLTRYGAIASGKRVPDDDTDGVCAALRLSGLVTTAQGLLRVRNRIYAHLFDAVWVRANLPDAEVRRQRAAVAKARWQIGSIAAAVLMVMAGLLWRTSKAEERANAEARKALAAAKKESAARKEAVSAQRRAEEQGTLALVAKHQAESDRTRAERESKLALDAKSNALSAVIKARIALRGEADAKFKSEVSAKKARDSAYEASAQAKRAAQAATAAREQAAAARHASYVSAIELTDQNLQNGSFPVAYQFFKDAAQFTKSERDFEWNYFAQRFRPERLTLVSRVHDAYLVAYSPDGRHIVTAGKTTACIWDAKNGMKLHFLKWRPGYACSVSYSPDGKHILIGGGDGTARVWDAITGKPILIIRHPNGGGPAEYSSDGRRIVTAGGKTVRIWDAAYGKALRVIPTEAHWSLAASFSPDGRRLVIGNNDFTAEVWDAETDVATNTTNKPLFILNNPQGDARLVKYSPDGKRIIAGGAGGTVCICDAATGKLLCSLDQPLNIVRFVAFSVDGKKAMTGCEDGTVRFYDVVSGKELLLIQAHTGQVGSVAFSPDGKQIVAGNSDGTASVWNVEKDAMADKPLVRIEGKPGYINCIAYSPNGKRIATGGWGGNTHVWDTATGRELLPLKGHTGYVNSVAFSPDGRHIVTSGEDKTARVWDAVTGRQLFLLKGHTGYVNSAAFSPDGRHIVTGSDDMTARVWDRTTGRQIILLKDLKKAGNSKITSVAYSPDGTRIVAGTGELAAYVWDARTGKTLSTLNRPPASVASATFSPDGTKIVTGNFFGAAHLWDAKTGRELLAFTGHTNGAPMVAFSSGGKRIITAGSDKTVLLWDVPTGKPLLTIKDGTSYFTALAFSPDGKTIVTGSWDGGSGKIRIWGNLTQQQREVGAELESRELKQAIITRLSRLPLAQVSRSALGLTRQYPVFRLDIADELNTIAWDLVDPARPRKTNEVVSQAAEIATTAARLSKQGDAWILSTLATAQLASGNLDAALVTQRQAVALLPDEEFTTEALKRYESLAKKRNQK